MFGRIIAFLYGLVCYLTFLVSFLYAIGFVGNVIVPKSIDSGPEGPLVKALLINAILLSFYIVAAILEMAPDERSRLGGA